MFHPLPGKHWLAAQWALWTHDALCGRLPSIGFKRWATWPDGCVYPCQGEAWGSHWQWGDLRLASWGCWLQGESEAWAYLALQDRFFCMDSWAIQAEAVCEHEEIDASKGLRYLESAALATERRLSRPEGRWKILADLEAAKIVSPAAARDWQMEIGSQLLPLCPWHTRNLPEWKSA